MSEPDIRERLWELQRRIAELAADQPLSSPAILALAEEIDRLINRIMGIRRQEPPP